MDSSRPWPVQAIVALVVVSNVLALIVSERLDVITVASFALGLWLAYSMWHGKTWAFTVTFMLTTLCLGLGITMWIVGSLLLQQTWPLDVIWGFLGAAVMVALLLHPATKRFARLDSRPRIEAS